MAKFEWCLCLIFIGMPAGPAAAQKINFHWTDPDPPTQVTSSLGLSLTPEERVASTVDAAQAAVDKQREIEGADSPNLIDALIKLAKVQSKAERREQAIETRCEILRIAEKHFGPQDYRTRSAVVEVETARRLSALSSSQFSEFQKARRKLVATQRFAKELGNSKKAEYLAEAHETMREVSGVASRECSVAQYLRYHQAMVDGQMHEAVRVTDRDLDEMRQRLGEDHPDYIELLRMRSLAQVSLRDFQPAEAGLREVERFQAANNAEPVHRCVTLSGIVGVQIMSGQLEAAEETANRLVSYAKQHSNSDPSQYASALEVKGKVAILQKKLDVAVDVMNQAIEIQSSPDGEPLELAELQGHVGAIYLSQRRLAEAEPLLLNASQVFRRLAGSSDKRAVEMTVRLAEVYLLTERPAEAEKLLKRVHATRIFQSGRDSSEARHVRDLRVTALRAMEKNAEADELLREPRPFVVPAAGP